MYDFIELFAPHLSRERVEQASRMHSRVEVDELFEQVDLPVY
jgi:LysR family cys regulon transcriptional activator